MTWRRHNAHRWPVDRALRGETSARDRFGHKAAAPSPIARRIAPDEARKPKPDPAGLPLPERATLVAILDRAFALDDTQPSAPAPNSRLLSAEEQACPHTIRVRTCEPDHLGRRARELRTGWLLHQTDSVGRLPSNSA